MTQAKECAFCPETANRSGEHLWSAWIGDLIPGPKKFSIKDEKGEVTSAWTSERLDWKANVVCEKCNNTWMSDIENNHAKPAMTDLIVGKVDVPISQSRARSIALSAFKTAVVFDHLRRDREPFFDRSARHEFRTSLTIPPNVGMWMTGFLPKAKGEAHSCYHEGSISESERIEMYVCTFNVGHLCIQVVGYKQHGIAGFNTKDSYIATRFWPSIADGFVWPDTTNVLRTVADFDTFSTRWLQVDAVPEIRLPSLTRS
jgi:hypothetical protein